MGGGRFEGAHPSDRAGGPTDLSRQCVSAKGAHPLRGDILFCVDAYNRWYVFDRNDALGTFDTWKEADALRNTFPAEESADSAPAWTPKSGGY